MNTPDITKADGVAVSGLVAAHAAGIHGIEFVALCVFAAVLVAADAHRRGKRNDRVAIAGPDTVVAVPAGDQLTDAQLDDIERAASEAAGA